jgi:membrane-bound lytic murein transglycosylase D
MAGVRAPVWRTPDFVSSRPARARFVVRSIASLGLLVAALGLADFAHSAPEPKAAPKAQAKPKKSEEKPKSSAPTSERDLARKKDLPSDKTAPDKVPEPKASPAKPRSSPDSDDPSPNAKPAAGAEGAAAGPRQGAGNRSLEAESAGSPNGETSPAAPVRGAAKAEPKPLPGRLPHQKGPIPKKPRSTLPPGAPTPGSDMAARREVAGGPTTDDLRADKDDAQLRALRQADRVLFPKSLDGARPGWSWDLPQPVESGDAEVVASGVPPEGRFGARPSAEAAGADSEWLKTLALPNLPVRFEARVVTYLKFYRDDPQGRAIARVWAQRSGRYSPALKAALSRAGLPTDLLFLSLIESSHNPTIVSSAGAAGLWQFMPDAGRMYGLTVDRWVDERFDAQRSTDAAVRYLSDLYRRFGNWDLAMAAYNMGHGGLSRAIRKFNTNDFWELSRYEAGIPWETTLYVPKILAIAVVMNNKRVFGLGSVAADPAVSFESALVDPGVSLDQIAAASGMSLSALQALNPQYLAGRTPPTRGQGGGSAWPVRLPVGKAAGVAARLPAEAPADASLESYVVRLGDTLDSIALARKTSEERLRDVNRLGKNEALSAGTVLLVPRHAALATAPASREPEVIVVPATQHRYSDRERVFYRVAPGDSLIRVAQALGVTQTELLAWNAIDETARLQPGMALQVYLPLGQRPTTARVIRESEAKVLVAGSERFFEHFEGLNGRRRITVVAREGDTLYSIGRRHGMSVGWMERINRRPRTKRLEPGETVIVYTQRPALEPPAAGAKTEPLPPVAPPFPDALPASSAIDPAATTRSNSGG